MHRGNKAPSLPPVILSVHHRITEVRGTSEIPKSNHPPSLPCPLTATFSPTGMEPSIHVAPALPPSSCSGAHLPSTTTHAAEPGVFQTSHHSSVLQHKHTPCGAATFLEALFWNQDCTKKRIFPPSSSTRSPPAVLCSASNEQREEPGRNLPSGKAPSLPSAHPALLHHSTRRGRGDRCGPGVGGSPRSAQPAAPGAGVRSAEGTHGPGMRSAASRCTEDPRSSVTGELGSITRGDRGC